MSSPQGMPREVGMTASASEESGTSKKGAKYLVIPARGGVAPIERLDVPHHSLSLTSADDRRSALARVLQLPTSNL